MKFLYPDQNCRILPQGCDILISLLLFLGTILVWSIKSKDPVKCNVCNSPRKGSGLNTWNQVLLVDQSVYHLSILNPVFQYLSPVKTKTQSSVITKDANKYYQVSQKKYRSLKSICLFAGEDSLVKLALFIIQDFKLNFDTSFVKIRQKLTEF